MRASAVCGRLEIVGSTVVNNSGVSSSVYVDVGTSSIAASASIRNTVFANATHFKFTTFATDGATSSVISPGHNIVSEDLLGVFTQAGDQIIADPMLGSLAHNRGPTDTHFPLTGSPVFDAGMCLDGAVHTDQRGYKRPFDLADIANAGDGCDVGAVEWSDENGDGADDGRVIFTIGFESSRHQVIGSIFSARVIGVALSRSEKKLRGSGLKGPMQPATFYSDPKTTIVRQYFLQL